MNRQRAWRLELLGGAAGPAATRSFLARPAFRIPLFIFAAIVFCVGAIWSFRSLGASAAELRIAPLAILALLILPSLYYGGLGLVLLAKSARLTLPLKAATTISAAAFLAEMLPVPGGAIVRIGALMKAGGTMQKSSSLVLVSAMLWIALAMTGAGSVLLWKSHGWAWSVLVVGAVGASGLSVWLWHVAGLSIALQTIVHRLAGIALTGLRLHYGFAALGVSVAPLETIPFVLAVLLGSASMVAPAGLGVSESIAALMATTGSIPPGIAFLAIGLDRVLCVGGCGIAVLLDLVMRDRK